MFVRIFPLVVALFSSSFNMRVLADATDEEIREQVLREAQNELDRPIVTVMDKSAVAPSGDKHDYYALAPYHWPNPNTENGLPYIFKDGEVNPEANTDKYDRVTYFRMGDAIARLALGYHLTREEMYAEQAAKWMRAWFTDPETRMNPNLEYSQCIVGRDRGEAIGLIRGMTIIDVVRAERWITDSKAWTKEDHESMRQWVRSFRDWLLTSELGAVERKALNNHGTWCAAQVAVLSEWLGDREQAAAIIREVKKNRIPRTITPYGRQPLEMLRTKSWDYSIMNGEALVVLADIGEDVGEDVWHFETPDGRGLKPAIDFLVPYALGEDDWPGKQIREWEPERLRPLLVRAKIALPEAGYDEILDKMPSDDVKSFVANELLGVDLTNDNSLRPTAPIHSRER